MPDPELHIWDMDHTLIDNDCDVSWKEFLVAQGMAPPEDLQQVQFFFDQYRANRLDWEAFMAFQLKEFRGRRPEDMAPVTLAHFEQVVQPRIYTEARELLAQQQAVGAMICLLTATNRPIATPLARHLGLAQVMATELELAEGRYTGRIAGVYCGGEGKVAHLRRLCLELGVEARDVSYYGDSAADIPTLEWVGRPVAVNPSPELRAAAEAGGWQVLAFGKTAP